MIEPISVPLRVDDWMDERLACDSELFNALKDIQDLRVLLE
jgi:hypothetical protein